MSDTLQIINAVDSWPKAFAVAAVSAAVAYTFGQMYKRLFR